MELFNYKMFDVYLKLFIEWIIGYIPNLISAIILLLLGWWVIKWINKFVVRFFSKKEYDETLERFSADLINWGLKILLLITVVLQLGIESSTLIAMLGAAGLAIGLALQGSLANFAGGVLILMFKPFKVGDYIEAQNNTGTVKEITIFTTKLLTMGNQLLVIPNGKLSNDTIKNYSAEPIRKNVMNIGISYGSDIKLAKSILLAILEKQENVVKESESQVVVSNLGESSIDLSLRFWAKNEHYWELNFKVLEAIKEEFDAQGIVIPFPQREVHLHS